MPKKILLVDDEIPLLEFLAERLKENGYEVVTATDGYQAVRISHLEKIDLIVLDVRMPAGGLNAYDNIRHSQATGNIPIIFCTTYIDDKILNMVEHDPLSDYIAKPFKIEAFLAKIRAKLGT